MLQRRELGDAGLAYIRERLVGNKMLSRLLREGLDLNRGNVWAYVPPSMTDAKTRQFDYAGVTRLATGTQPERFDTDTGVWTPVYNLIEPSLVDVIERFLREQEYAVVIWEDAQKEAADPWVQQHPEEPLLFVGDEVYYIVDHQTTTVDTIHSAMASMVAWWSSPAVLAIPPIEALEPLKQRHTTIAPQHLQPLVEHIQLLFFLAYDMEGYVFWSPKDSLIQPVHSTGAFAAAIG